MKTGAYADFWQHIHKQAKKNQFPLRVMFELTYRCNFSCKHCYIPPGYRNCKELKTKEVFSIIDQLAESGCFYLGFTGGEPFMRRDIMRILRHARKKGLVVIVYSNGSLISRSTARKLAKLRINKVDLTLPAMTAAAFENITGVKGSYDKVFKAIGYLSENKVPLGFKTQVLKENQGEIIKIIDFARSLGAPHRLDDMLSRRLDGSDRPYLYRGLLKPGLGGKKTR